VVRIGNVPLSFISLLFFLSLSQSLR